MALKFGSAVLQAKNDGEDAFSYANIPRNIPTHISAHNLTKIFYTVNSYDKLIVMFQRNKA